MIADPDAAARPAETVAETVPARHATPDLAELRRLAEAATPGPWAARYGVSWEACVCATTGSLADVDSTANAELIAAAVNALPALLGVAAERDALAAKVERVRALHFGEYVEDEDQNRCFGCGDDWPCPTIRALGGAES